MNSRWNGELLKYGQPKAQQAAHYVNQVINEFGIAEKNVSSRYKYALRGFSAKLTDKQLKALKASPRVKLIEQVVQIKVFDKVDSLGPSSANNQRMAAHNYQIQWGQEVPWGVARVNGPRDGTGKTAWIIGSGIDYEHDDLNVNTSDAKSFIPFETDADDDYGHGTYVAGLLAAKDNNEGIVGVAAGAWVVPIKVSKNGDLHTDLLDDAVDYVAGKASPDDIVNISVGFYLPLESLVDIAIKNAADGGIRFVIAAGNGATYQFAGDYTPSHVDHQNVWTVSAFRANNDEFAIDFNCPDNHLGSNYGNPPIDYSAPGEDLPSLLIGDSWGFGYQPNYDCSDDGTSFAAPIVAGMLLAAPNSITIDGHVNGDPDGNPDPIPVFIPLPTLEVTISGPNNVNSGQPALFTASVSHADGPVSYQWLYRKTGEDGWFFPFAPSNLSFFSHTFYGPDNHISIGGVKVTVTSAGETDIAILNLAVYGEGCQNGPGGGGGIGINKTVPAPCD